MDDARRTPAAADRYPFPARPGLVHPPEYAALRHRHGLARVVLGSGHPARLAVRHRDVRAVLTDPRFSRAAAAGLHAVARKPESLSLHQSDPPDHTRRRRAVGHAFTAARAEQLRPEVARIAARLLDRIEATGPPAELVGDYTLPLSLTVICSLLGIPVDAGLGLREQVSVVMSRNRWRAGEVVHAHQEIDAYFAGLLDTKRARLARGEPAGDLLMELLAEPDPGRRLRDDEILVHSSGLLIAGHETAAHILAGMLYLVLTRPGHARLLRQEPGVLPGAIEEMLRWGSFAAGGGAPPHVARTELELAGEPIPAGGIVVPALDAANRDPAVFESPDELDLTRRAGGHLGFGTGRHTCLGTPLARVELQVGMAALLGRFPDLRLAPDGPTWRDSMFIGGPATLPVEW